MHKTKVSEKHLSDHKKRFERKRYLNVIYFIDSNRTRTLKFSIGTSYLTVGLLSVAVVWSLIATTLLIRDRFVIAELSRHSKSLLDTVFAYQTRYDEVYEKAYPEPIGNTEDELAEDTTDSAAPVALPRVADGKDKPKDKASANLEAVKSVLPIDQAAIAKDKANIEKSPEGLPIAIDNFASTVLGKSLTIRLSLKNLTSPTKSSGSINGLVRFVDSKGESHMIQGRTTPTGGEDAHFNIRYFKNKNLVFEAPKDLGGKFVDVTVTIKDDQGNSKDFPYAVNKEVPAVVAPTTPVAKAEVSMPTVSKAPDTEAVPAIKASEGSAGDESSDAIDTNVTSGATDTTNDASN